jgi:hypothetical protein
MIRAVLLGLVAAIGATGVAAAYAGAITVFAPTLIAVLTRAPPQPWDGPASLMVDAVLSLAAATAFGALGGFVAGSLHRRSPLLAGTLMGLTSIALGTALSLTVGQQSQHGPIYAVIDNISGFAAPVFGSLLARRENARVAT